MTLYKKIRQLCIWGRFSDVYLAEKINLSYDKFLEKAKNEDFTTEELEAIQRVFKEKW